MKKTALDWFYDKIKSHFKHDGDLAESVLFYYSIAKQKEGKIYTGLNDCNGRKLFQGDRIKYKYYDTMEPRGYNFIEGIITHENGCFCVRQIGFNYERAGERPETLHEWLKQEKCKKIKK